MRDQRRRKKISRGRPADRPPSRPASEPLKSGIVCVVLVIIIWFAFGQTVGHGFINYDDEEYITENGHVLSGLSWENAKWAFTTGHTGYAHPITWLTHQLDCQFFGVWAGGHHLTSVLIHIVNSLLLFFLFWKITRDLWPSAFVAALFAIHPLHVESVAWAAERKDVLSGLFFLLMLHAYTAYAARPQVGRYLLALFLFVLGILSKPMLVTVPCLLLLFDYWPLRRMTFPASKNDAAGLGRLILEKIPFVLVAISWSFLTFSIQKEIGAVAQAPLALSRRVANALGSYAMYLWNTFWPHDLALFYPYPRTVALGAAMISVVVLIVVSIVCFVKRRSSPYLIVGWLWFLGMLVPVIGFVQVGEQARADRYTYLPQIGLCLFLTWGAVELATKWRRGREILAVTAVVAIITFTALTYVQASYWQNNETLWKHSLAVTTGNHVALNNLGNALMKQGRLDEASVHLRNALEVYRDYPEANNNLGYVLASKGNHAEAIDSYRAALRARPNYPKAHSNLAISLSELGKNDEALEQFNEALRLNPNYPDTHYNLAILLFKLGRRDEGVAQLRETLRLKPGDTEVRAQLRELGVVN